MIRKSGLIVLEVAVALVAAAGLGAGVFWWRLSQGPIPLPALKRDVESQLSAARNGRPVQIDSVQLSWNPEARALDLRAIGVRALDETGAVLTESREVAFGVSVQNLLVGRVSLVRAAFVGGDVAVTLHADGAVDLAFAREGASPDIRIPAPPPDETVQQRVNRVLDGVSAALAAVGPDGGLRELSIREARLTILDKATNARWSADDGAVLLARDGEALRVVAEASLAGPRGPAPAALRIDTDTALQTANLRFEARGVRLAAIVSPAALGPLASLDAPVTADVTVGLDRARGVTQMTGAVAFGRGGVDLAGGRLALDGGRIEGAYDIADDTLVISRLTIAGERTRISGEARLQDASTLLAPPPAAGPRPRARFSLTLPDMAVEAPGLLEGPVELKAVAAAGDLRLDAPEARFDRFTARFGEAVFDLKGRVYAEPDRQGRLRPGVAAEGTIQGTMPVRRVLAFWPTTIAPRSRAWMSDALLAGTLTDGVARVDLKPQDFGAPRFPDPAVDLQFKFTDGQIRYLETMSPLVEAAGEGVIRGDSMDLRVRQGRVEAVTLTDGRVRMPRLRADDAVVIVSGRASGEVRAMAELLRPEPVRLLDRLPVNAASLAGTGAVDFEVVTPVGLTANPEDATYTVAGRLGGVAAVAADDPKLAITEGQLELAGDQDVMTVTGPVRFGETTVAVNWRETLDETLAAPSAFHLAGAFAPEDLERLGYLVRPYADGRIGVDFRGEGRGLEVARGTVALDFETSTLTAPNGIWRKPPGRPARGGFTLARGAEGAFVLTDVSGEAPGLSARGALTFSAEGRLLAVSDARLAIEDRMRIGVEASRDANGLMTVSARGPMFDATPFMAVAPPAQAAAALEQAEAPPPVTYRLETEELRFRGGANLAAAEAVAVMRGDVLWSLKVTGQSPGANDFALDLNARVGEPRGQLSFRAEDAGFALKAVTGADNIAGGLATATGEWRPGLSPEAEINLRVEDFAVERLPAMARLVSSVASLRGLVEMLDGSGMSFARLDAPMALRGSTLHIRESRAAGASIGITAKGQVDLVSGSMALNGVVVPSYGLNSMLGGVPLLGDLFVSRQGEGVVGITYSLAGPIENARVGVNPLSVLTPGIFRRIFEPLPRPQPAAAPGGG